MSGEPHGATRAPDKRRPTTVPFAMVPPETPPMMDPSFRYPRLTPNLREMIHGFSTGIPDASGSGPMQDFLSSPDPTAMYNSMQIGSPILRDFYPGQSPVPQQQYDQSEQATERLERMSGACAEMNALFNNCYPETSNEGGYRSDNQEGIMSLMSSPELQNGALDVSASGVSSSEQDNNPRDHHGNKKSSDSERSSQTRPPVDTSSSSPSNSSPGMPMKPENVKVRIGSRLEGRATTKTKKASSHGDKPKRPSARSSTKAGSTSGSASVSGSASATGRRSTPQAQMPMTTTASALMAANAAAMNPGMAGLMPFAMSMPPGMGHMLPAPGTVHYQGRPMAFVAGAHGTELIPMDMLAQATAVQYGAAAQAAVNRMMQPVVGNGSMPPRPVPGPFEPVGGSRKKRRRQLLERSGCSEEQARQNRAHALKRLRQKKTLRSQQSTVRYACRKRIAMVRPRVNGRFATKEEVEECQRTKE